MTGRNITLASLSEWVGQELGVSDWFQIDQARINAFADATGDHQWIHVDEERAAAGAVGSTIAHGYLVLSLLPMMLAEIGVMPAGIAQALNYGADRIRFTNVVRVNQRVRNHAVLLAATSKPSGLLLKIANTMEIEGEEKPALVAESLTLLVPA